VVLELWDLEDPTDGPNGHHFVLGLLACWCEDPLNLGARGDTTSPVTIENLPDRDFRTGSRQAANKFPTTSVLFNVGIVEILSCNSLYVE
jgi:hypothetical protein